MSWRIAESLKKLRVQINEAFPNRSKVSDGAIGDEKHRSRASDHNPHFNDKNGIGIVSAIDVTHDPPSGMDCHKLAAALIRSRDPRIKYIIWNGQICSSKQSPWQWRKYTGKNAHKHHLHLSVNSDSHLFDDPRPWDLGIVKKSEVTPQNVGAKIDALKTSAAQSSLTVKQSEKQMPSPPPSKSSGAAATDGTAEQPDATRETAQFQPTPDNTAPAIEQTNINSPQGKMVVTEEKNEQEITSKTETAPAKDGSTSTATKMTILGFAVPTGIAVLIETVKSLIAQGFVSAQDLGNLVLSFIREHTKYFLMLIGLIIVLLIVKKAFKQATFLLTTYVNANPKMHDVKVVPAEVDAKRWWEVWR